MTPKQFSTLTRLESLPLILPIVLGIAAPALVGCSGRMQGGDAEEGDDDGGGSGPAGQAGRTGQAGAVGGGSGTGGQGDCAGIGCAADTAKGAIRRLTRDEYNHTVADLLGVDTGPAGAFPAEEVVKGWNNNAAALSFPGLLAEQSVAVSGSLAKVAAQKAATFASCAAKTVDAACARSFIQGFGKRAWRRPLDGTEVDRLAGVFAQGADAQEGLELVAQAILISAPFHYRIEPTTTAPRKPSSWEMASRLSYLIWNSMPDEQLFAAAEADKLTSEAEVVAQAKRMLADPKSMRAFRSFNEQWFELPRVGLAAKDPKVFPSWDNAYAELLEHGAEVFLEHVVKEGKLGDLFTAPYVFANDALAPYYGVAKPGSSAFVKVTPDGGRRRAGLLTQGGILVGHAGFSSTSPTFRGKFIREQFLCGTIPQAPPQVNVMIGAAPPGQTTREHYSEHIDNPQCSGCHSLMDPIGFAFEEFDAAGIYRTTEHGKTIDASGDASDVDVGTFVGVNELGEKLARSEHVRACIATQWFRFAYGRLEAASDEETLASLKATVAGEGTFSALLMKTVAQKPFLEVAPNTQ